MRQIGRNGKQDDDDMMHTDSNKRDESVVSRPVQYLQGRSFVVSVAVQPSDTCKSCMHMLKLLAIAAIGMRHKPARAAAEQGQISTKV